MAIFFVIGISPPAHAADLPPGASAKPAETSRDAYTPGMGEIMGATQMRHAKLWLAGKARNWELAGYELDEIREGLEDAVKYHPVFKKDAPVADMLGKFMGQPLDAVGKAVEAKNAAEFRKAYDRLTAGCNACHRAAGQGFIVIKRPGISPYSNQEFGVKTK